MDEHKNENFYLELTRPERTDTERMEAERPDTERPDTESMEAERERAQIPALTVPWPEQTFAAPPQTEPEQTQPAERLSLAEQILAQQPIIAPPYMEQPQAEPLQAEPLQAEPLQAEQSLQEQPALVLPAMKPFQAEQPAAQQPAFAPPHTEPPQTEPPKALNFTPAYAPADRQGKRKGERKGGGFSGGAVAALMICCVLLSSALGFGGGWLAAGLNRPAAAPEQSAAAFTPDESYVAYVAERLAARPEGSPLTAAQVAAVAADSVVEIVTQREVQNFNFWGFSTGSHIREGAGSGVIIAENGYIITNNHVIEKTRNIEVTLRSGESYEAKLVATDPKTDVAVIKIEAAGLTTATMGDSGALVVGEPAVVIGNPLGQLGGTVTNGIVSALDRTISFEEDDGTTKTLNVLQTDASVNGGNSGGGLFNQYGELVGVVVAKSEGFGVEGLGFAIPINDVRDVIDDLIAYGYARGRIALGVTLVTISDEQAAASYNMTKPGIYIFRVDEGSNAERGGLRPGDLIIRVNGQEISDAAQVSEIIQKLSVGDTLGVVYERGGESFSVNIVMQETIPADVDATRLRY